MTQTMKFAVNVLGNWDTPFIAVLNQNSYDNPWKLYGEFTFILSVLEREVGEEPALNTYNPDE